ncbi:hypothetical protein ACEPAF_6260 [Sanghuangporus sanghuang]
MPLYVQFLYGDDMVRVLQQALEYKERWTYLHAHLASDDWRIFDVCPSLVFPSLKTLCIFIDHDLGGTRCDDLFSCWKFPRVDDLQVRDALPTSRFFDYSLPTTFTYKSQRSALSIDGTFLRSLRGFLGSATSLRTLELDLSQISVALGPEDDLKVVLPTVTHFSIMNLDWPGSYRFGEEDPPLGVEDFLCILYAFHLPNVQKISVSMNWNDDEEELYDLLCQMERWGAGFQEIRIESNRVLNKKLLRDLFPKANIEVTMPYPDA